MQVANNHLVHHPHLSIEIVGRHRRALGSMKSPAIGKRFIRCSCSNVRRAPTTTTNGEVAQEIAGSNRTIIRNRLRAKDLTDVYRERLAR